MIMMFPDYVPGLGASNATLDSVGRDVYKRGGVTLRFSMQAEALGRELAHGVLLGTAYPSGKCSFLRDDGRVAGAGRDRQSARRHELSDRQLARGRGR